MSYRITEKCIGCTLCAKNCPVFAISGETKSMHQINETRCVECGACGNVCPVSAIVDGAGNVAEKLEKKSWHKPVINSEECSGCSLCVDICTFHCLKISDPTFQGDTKLYATLAKPKECVACNMCYHICPMSAIEMKEELI